MLWPSHQAEAEPAPEAIPQRASRGAARRKQGLGGPGGRLPEPCRAEAVGIWLVQREEEGVPEPEALGQPAQGETDPAQGEIHPALGETTAKEVGRGQWGKGCGLAGASLAPDFVPPSRANRPTFRAGFRCCPSIRVPLPSRGLGCPREATVGTSEPRLYIRVPTTGGSGWASWPSGALSRPSRGSDQATINHTVTVMPEFDGVRVGFGAGEGGAGLPVDPCGWSGTRRWPGCPPKGLRGHPALSGSGSGCLVVGWGRGRRGLALALRTWRDFVGSALHDSLMAGTVQPCAVPKALLMG